MRTIVMGTGEYYHVYNRGVDKRPTFADADDYRRFLSAVALSKHALRNDEQLVRLHAYTLMPNHYHLLLEQMADDGVVQFMQRLGTRYTKYFNARHERTGSLFEAPYKAKHVDDDAYLSQVARYIHRNPLELPGHERMRLMAEYPWSSYRHYLGERMDPLVDDDVLWEMFNSPQGVAQFHE